MRDKTYRIKPLTWVRIDDNVWTANTVLGRIDLWETEGEWVLDVPKADRIFRCRSLEDGKAKAEAYYRERILPALEEVTQ